MLTTLLLELLAAVFTAAVLVAAGARLAFLARLPLSPRLAVPAHFFLGAGALTVALTAAGLVGVLTRPVVVGGVLALAVAGRWRKTRWPPWGVMAALALPLVVLLPVALAPPFFYDALCYHLGLPWQALLEGGWRPHPENHYSALPPLAQCVALPALALGLERVPALLHLASFCAAGAAVFALAQRLGSPPWAAVLAGAALPVLPILVVVPAFPAAEGWGIGGLVAATAVCARRRLPPGGAALGGALAGVALASRAQLVPLVAALALVAMARASSGRQWGKGAACLLLFSSPWWAKNLLLLGAPLAPWGWEYAGQEALVRDARVALALASTPREVWNVLAEGLGQRGWYVPALMLVALLLVVGGQARRQGWLAVLVGVGLVGWAALAAVPRYLGTTAALALALGASLTRHRAGKFAFVAVAAGVTGQGWLATVELVGLLGGLALLRQEPAAVRATVVVNDPFPAFAAAQALPPVAKVLLVGEPRGYGFPRPFVVTSYYDESPLAAAVEVADTPCDIAAWLRTRGFTHLLINWGELRRLAPGYPVAPWRSESGRRNFFVFLKSLGAPPISRGGVEIFCLGPASPLR